MRRAKEKQRRIPSRKERALKEYEGVKQWVDDLTPYVEQHPDDKWSAGQLRHYSKRLAELQKELGIEP